MDIDARMLAFMRRFSFNRTGDVNAGSAAFFSPMLKRSVFVNVPETWQRTIEVSTDPAETRDRFKLVRSIYKLVERLNTRLVRSMSSEVWTERRLAHNAMQEVSRQGLSVDWLHGAIQVLLLDRIIFAVDGHSESFLPYYQRLHSGREREPEGFEKIYKAYREWECTMDRFCDSWSSSTSFGSTSNEVPSSVVQGRDVVLSSLVKEVRLSDGRAKCNIVFNNFCVAAVGLRALMLKGEALAVWGSGDEKLGDLLRRECPDVPEFAKANEDYSILRALYAMVAVSPVVLLAGFSVTKSSHKRLPLNGMVQVASVEGPTVSDRLALMEFFLFDLVVDMALKGPRVFYEYMGKVVKYWRGANDFPRPVVWRLAQRKEDSGQWTEEEARLHGLISAHIQRRLNVEHDVRNGKEFSLHSLTQSGVTDMIIVSENQGGAETNGTSARMGTVNRTKELIEILKASVVTRIVVDSAPSTTETEKTGCAASDNHAVGAEFSAMEVEDGPSGLSEEPITKGRSPQSSELEDDIVMECHEEGFLPANAVEEEADVRQEEVPRSREEIRSCLEDMEVCPEEFVEPSNGERRDEDLPHDDVAKEANFDQESLSRSFDLHEELVSSEVAASIETEERDRDSEVEEVVVPSTEGGRRCRRLGVSAGRPQQSQSTELEVEEALTASYDEAERRTCLARLDEFIESQRESEVKVKGKKKRQGGYDKQGTPSKKRATFSPSKTSSPTVSRRSEIYVNRAPISRASTASVAAESVRDTFGHAFELPSAWLQSERLRTLGYLLLDLVPTTHGPCMECAKCIANECGVHVQIAWSSRSFSIPIYDNHGLLRKAASCAIGCLTKDGKYATTEVVTKLEWDALGDSGQKSLFAQKNVLVKGMLPAALNPMQEFNLQEMSKIVDTFAQLQARDCTDLPLDRGTDDHTSYQMVRSSLRDFVENYRNLHKKKGQLKGPSKFPIWETCYRALNFLDIPVADDIFRVSLDDCSQYLVRNSFATSIPSDAVATFLTDCSPKDVGKRWMLVSATSSWSNWHVDAAGLATVLCMVEGDKILFTPVKRQLLPGAFTEDAARGFDADVIHLSKGDVFFMRPATTHLVATYSESIVFGGHFYCWNVMKDTLRGMVLEHYLGRDVTNTEHVKAPVLLMKAVCSLASRYVNGKAEDVEASFPIDEEELAYLLVTVRNLDQLAPELPSNSDEIVWQNTAAFQNDFGYACEAVKDILQRRGMSFRFPLKRAEEFFCDQCNFIEDKLRSSEDEEDHRFSPVEIRCLCRWHEKFRPGMLDRIRRE